MLLVVVDDVYPYTDPRNHWLEFDLVDCVPPKGENLLEVSLESRPDGLTGGVTIQEVEVEVRYSPYPVGLGGSTKKARGGCLL